jgi:hypothetical protein
MPDPSGLPPPYLDPSQYPEYLDAQKKQMLAQMLMQNAQQANQTPQNWDQMRVVPRKGMLSNVASAADALLAGRAMKGSMNAQQKYFQNMYGGDQSAAPSSSSLPPESTGPVAPGMAPQQVDSTAAPASQNPLIPSGMGKSQAQMLMGLLGPQKYGESIVAPNLKPAEIKAQIRAAGIDPDSPQGRRIALSALNKQTTNMQDVRPGGTLFDVGKGQPIFSAPQNGVQTQWGPQGPQQSVVPGAPQANAAMVGAETAGKVINTPQTLPTQGGGSTIGYPSDLLGAPPALRGGPQANGPQANTGPAAAPAAPKGYFPSTQPPPVPKDPNDPWSGMPKLPVSKALGAPDAFTEGRLKAAGAKDAELSSQYGKEADLADQKLQYNTEAVKALPAAETGPMSEWMTENRAKLLEWGVPESMVPGSGKVTPTMELNKNLKQSALQGARAIFGSRMTQMEVRLQHEELSPSTSMTKDAIASLMQQDNIKQQYAKQRSQDYGKYVQQGGDPLRFESWYAKTFPLTKFAQVQAHGPMQPKGYSRDQLEEELRKRGYLK